MSEDKWDDIMYKDVKTILTLMDEMREKVAEEHKKDCTGDDACADCFARAYIEEVTRHVLETVFAGRASYVKVVQGITVEELFAQVGESLFQQPKFNGRGDASKN